MNTTYQSKSRGILLGLAIGDALGAPVEFLSSPGSLYISEMGDKIAHFHDNYRSPKGVWTDDTEMALCIADSLLVNQGYDSYDIMRRFRAWAKEGYRTYDNKPAADVGLQTTRAINEFNRRPIVPKDHPKTTSAGNGAIMRLAPIIIANTSPRQKDIEPTLKMAALSCRETHDSIAAITTTILFATTLYCALRGLSKNQISADYSKWIHLSAEYNEFWLENTDALVGRALDKHPTKFKDLGGYIVDAFAISLWGLLHYDNFKDGMLAVIRLGGDTDTNGACYGQLAGAYYGYEDIPAEWRKGVYKSDEITKIADELLKMPKCPILRTRFEDDEYFKEPD